MMKIDLNKCSSTLDSKDARSIANSALKWFVRGHHNYGNDHEMLNSYSNDYRDLMAIAHLVEDYDAELANMTEKVRKKRRSKIGKAMRDLDTIVRDQITEKVYYRFG
jgi:hypothetical protein